MTFSLYQEKAKLTALLLALLLATLLAATPAHAACKAPDPPDLPDAETAVLAQMIKAKKDVKAFMMAGKAFMECTRSDSKHDKVVDQMRRLAKEFNGVVKSYKSRVKK